MVALGRAVRPICTRSREIRPAPSLHRASTDALIYGVQKFEPRPLINPHARTCGGNVISAADIAPVASGGGGAVPDCSLYHIHGSDSG